MDDQLNSDNLMPLDSSVLNFDAPAEQEREVREEQSAFLASTPIINALLAWFDTQIASTDSIDFYDVTSSVDIKAQVLAHQILKSKLIDYKSNLEAQRETFMPNRD